MHDQAPVGIEDRHPDGEGGQGAGHRLDRAAQGDFSLDQATQGLGMGMAQSVARCR